MDSAITALVLIRIGQELGTASPATQSIHDLLELLASAAAVFLRG